MPFEKVLTVIFSEAGIAWVGWILFAAHVWITHKASVKSDDTRTKSHEKMAAAQTEALNGNTGALTRLAVLIEERLPRS